MNDSNQYFAGKAVPHNKVHSHWDCSIAARPAEGLVLEFGVYGATTTNYIAERVSCKVYGFDSFEGLPENWNSLPRGFFKVGAAGMISNLPKVRENVELIVGMFEDTLPGFVKAHPEPISLMHVDCDLYSSTKTVFHYLGDRIVPGTIIMFDEYIDYPGWQEHEFKAFHEYLAESGRAYQYWSFNPDTDASRVSVRMG